MSAMADMLDSNGSFGRNPVFGSVGNFVQGVVNDNSNKDFPGMVQVIFTVWQDKKSICEWIPVLQSYAGDEYGSYLLPEVKDVVLVGFVGSGMTRPFVLGSLFRANGKIQ
ncbi:MAG: phage baseplate assembly protein V, partial [Angelakisella sp.]